LLNLQETCSANGPTDHSRASCEVCDAASPKYAFSDDFSEISAAQTLTVYQHATRTGSFAEHLEARIDDLAHYRRLPRENLLALRWRHVSRMPLSSPLPTRTVPRSSAGSG